MKTTLLFYFFLTTFFYSENYNLSPNSKITVAGSSNVRDWTIVSNTVEGNAIIKIENNKIKSIEKLSVSLLGESLKSGRDGMDEHTYKALKTKEYQTISFSLDKINKIENVNNDQQILQAEGNLNIAGVSKHITMTVKCFIIENEIFFEGELNTKMTEFNVTPPKALLGRLRTKDAITISYKVNFQQLK